LSRLSALTIMECTLPHLVSPRDAQSSVSTSAGDFVSEDAELNPPSDRPSDCIEELPLLATDLSLLPVAPKDAPKVTGMWRRPQPRLKIVSEKIRAQRWMHERLEDLTIDQLASGNVVIFSTHEMEPPPQFKTVWYTVGEHHCRGQLSASEIACLNSASACLVFSDILAEEHKAHACDLVRCVGSLGSEAPPTFLLSHLSPQSSSPSLLNTPDVGDDTAYSAFVLALDSGFDDVILSEPSGLELACEIQSRLMCQMRATQVLNEKLNEQRAACQYVDELEEEIDRTVWEYFRVRLQTSIPFIDPEIDAGRPRVIKTSQSCLAVGAKLGEGSFGKVYKLVDKNRTTVEVLKMIDKKPITDFRGIAGLQRQIRIMELLSSEANVHPNITKFHQVLHSETHVLFRLEYGGPLDLYKRLMARECAGIDREKHLGIDKTASIILQCMAAISHLHTVPGVVHRDIKPENYIVDETMDEIQVKLTDFDTAKVIQSNARCSGVVIGTFPFMAPEMVLDKYHDSCAADVWSLAVVCLEVVCHLRILRTELGVSLQKNIGREEKRVAEKMMMQRIRVFFATPGNTEGLLERNTRPSLRGILKALQTLHMGMLTSASEDRWKANKVYETGSDLLVTQTQNLGLRVSHQRTV